jgi:hypothetical protein
MFYLYVQKFDSNMKSNYLFILFLGVFINMNAQLSLWQSFTDSIPTLSSPRASDLNNDGIKDIVIGGGTDGFASNNGIMAFNGVDGTLLWKRGSRNEVFGSPIFQDITNDGIKDVFITGRQAQLLAINGSNGQLLWDYFPYSINPADSGLFNFYNPQFIPDVNNDGKPDLLVANGGDHSAPDWQINRPPGHLMIINSLNGQLLAKAVVPDSAETYCSPIVADVQGNGTLWILYGTGGENLGGSFWACPLNDLLLSNSLANSIQLDSDQNKGYIAPAAISKNNNNQYDIVIQSFGGKIKKIKGANFSSLWTVQLPNTESSAEPVLGNFIGVDNVPDVLAILFKGISPSYTDFYQVLINGSTGQLAFKDSLGALNYVSANAMDFDNNGRDEGMVSVTYFESGSYKHRLQKINFVNGNINQISSTKAGVNLGSTPLLTDLDGDNLIDLVYAYKKDSLNPIGWNGIYVQREELNIQKPNAGIAWGSYLGTNNDGVYDLDAVNCGFGSVIANANVIQPTCNDLSNGSVTLTPVQGAGPYTYLWTINSNDSSITNLAVGTYSVMVTNSQGCFETRTFNINNPYLISFGGIVAPACLGGTNGMATVNSSGCPCQFSTCTFLWDNGVTTKPNNSLTSGWHTVVIHHPGGCVVTDSVFVPEALPVIVDTQIVNNICYGMNGGSINLIPSNYPPTTYNWSNGETTHLNDSLPASDYSVFVSDARGCSDTLDFTIFEPNQILVTSQIQNVDCNGNTTGEIQLQAQGGNGGYSYFLNQNIASSMNTNLTAGNYAVYVTDSMNCSSQIVNVTITEPSALNLSLTSTPEIIGLDGTATANVNGGTSPYLYIWDDSNSQPEYLAVYLNSGWYTVLVTDANGCQISDSVFVDSLVGIVENDKNDFIIYPNPTKEIIEIQGQGQTIRIRDLNGKLTQELAFQNKIYVGHLSSGVYTLEIISDNRQINRIRFTKMD